MLFAENHKLTKVFSQVLFKPNIAVSIVKTSRTFFNYYHSASTIKSLSKLIIKFCTDNYNNNYSIENIQGVSVSPITELEEYSGYDAEVMKMAKSKVVTTSDNDNEISNSSRHLNNDQPEKSRGDM